MWTCFIHSIVPTPLWDRDWRPRVIEEDTEAWWVEATHLTSHSNKRKDWDLNLSQFDIGV